MKKVLLVMLLLAVGGAWLGTQAAAPAIAAVQPGLSPEEVDYILQRTVQIRVERSYEPTTLLIEIGLGSIVRIGGDLVIVTHNHWGPLLDPAATVKIQTSDQRELDVMAGWQVWAAVRNQDEGSLIFSAPAGVGTYLQGAQLDIPEALQPALPLAPGTVAGVVHHPVRGEMTVGVQAQIVIEQTGSMSAPVYVLRSLNGQAILPGDSGGGVWVDGSLVGNLWATVMVPVNAQPRDLHPTIREGDWQYTDESIAAILPRLPSPPLP